MKKSITTIPLILILSIAIATVIITRDTSINSLKLWFSGKDQQVLIEVQRNNQK